MRQRYPFLAASVTALSLVLPAASAQEAPGDAEPGIAALAASEGSRVQGVAAAELQRARARLAELDGQLDAARTALADAQAAEQALIAEHDAATAEQGDARRDLGNLARLAYTSGPTEWTLIETFLDSTSPGDAMRRASLSQTVAERQSAQWEDAVARADLLAEQRDLASASVAAADGEAARIAELHSVASEQVRAIETAIAAGGLSGPDGIAAVAALCGDPGVGLCQPSGWGEGQLTRDAVWLMRVVRQRWPQIEAVGGYRPTDAFPDHPTGRAVDVMVTDDGESVRGADLGDEIAQYFMQHADDYGVMYIIWDQRIWSVERDPIAPPDQWRLMEDRGSRTANHQDHVHISVSTGVSGSDIYQQR